MEAHDRSGLTLLLFKRVEIYDVSPPRGGIAGGTLVDIIGTGFDDETRFVFEDRELVVEERLGDQHIIARTPRHRAGWISLTAESAFATAVLPSAFEYFDPTSQFGGLWVRAARGFIEHYGGGRDDRPVAARSKGCGDERWSTWAVDGYDQRRRSSDNFRRRFKVTCIGDRIP